MAEGGNNPHPNLDDDTFDDDIEVDGQLPPNVPQNRGRVNSVQIKLPTFWKADPDLWFLQIEAQFHTAGIRSDLSKYNQIVGKLDTDTLSAVSDIVKNPPANDKYITLKNRLTRQFAESDSQKLKTLFSDLSMNDDKPSDLLRKMKDKSCNKVDDNLLQELWKNRLPQQIQAILSCSNEPLAQKVIMADKIYETIDHNSIQALSQTNDFASQFCKLEDSINSLRKEFNKSRSRSSSAHRSRSTSRSHQRAKFNPDHCHYHQQYHEKARKCVSPCSFKHSNKKKHTKKSKN